jgi:hypothetical protein
VTEPPNKAEPDDRFFMDYPVEAEYVEEDEPEDEDEESTP